MWKTACCHHFKLAVRAVDQFVKEVEGSDVLLSCDLPGGGRVVQWAKDGEVMWSSNNGSLWLHQINHTHQGEYTCSYKKKHFNYYLTVLGE